MADRKRTQLRSADGTVLGDIEPPPSVIKEFIQSWINWLSNLHTYIGIVNENFFTVEDVHLIGGSGEPAFENSWVNVVGNEPAGFYKDPYGRVWLQGHVDSGTVDTAIFTLPTGYRPATTILITTSENNTSSVRLRIQTDGTVDTRGATVTTGQNIEGSFRI
jgi:hypothetical protein